jgi:NTP pyrophosphatase (non-canonical NTP hydrolase)
MNLAKTHNIFALVIEERKRQDRLMALGKFAFTCADKDGLTNAEKLTVLIEETGEVARAILNLSQLASDALLKNRVVCEYKLQEELIQVAAVAVAWLESLELEPVERLQL